MKSLKFNIFRYRFIFGQAGAIIICGLTLFVSLFFSFIFVNTSTTPVSSVQQLSNQRRTEDGYIIDSLFAEQYPEYKDDILTFSQEIFLFPGANWIEKHSISANFSFSNRISRQFTLPKFYVWDKSVGERNDFIEITKTYATVLSYGRLGLDFIKLPILNVDFILSPLFSFSLPDRMLQLDAPRDSLFFSPGNFRFDLARKDFFFDFVEKLKSALTFLPKTGKKKLNKVKRVLLTFPANDRKYKDSYLSFDKFDYPVFDEELGWLMSGTISNSLLIPNFSSKNTNPKKPWTPVKEVEEIPFSSDHGRETYLKSIPEQKDGFVDLSMVKVLRNYCNSSGDNIPDCKSKDDFFYHKLVIFPNINQKISPDWRKWFDSDLDYEVINFQVNGFANKSQDLFDFWKVNLNSRKYHLVLNSWTKIRGNSFEESSETYIAKFNVWVPEEEKSPDSPKSNPNIPWFRSGAFLYPVVATLVFSLVGALSNLIRMVIVNLFGSRR